jgi:hypothetical protein
MSGISMEVIWRCFAQKTKFGSNTNNAGKKCSE